MGNKQAAAAPAPQYEQAAALFTPTELAAAKQRFMVLSGNHESTTLEVIQSNLKAKNSYVQRHVLPKLLSVCDLKKDGAIDSEEYVCSMAVLRCGSIEERCRYLLAMYDSSKGGNSISRDSLRQLLVDATLFAQEMTDSDAMLTDTLKLLRPLSETMVEAALLQYSTTSRMELTDFATFIRMESTLQAMLGGLASMLAGA